MNWKKCIKSALKALLLFGIVLFLCWVNCLVTGKDKLDVLSVAISYMLTDTAIRYYEKED